MKRCEGYVAHTLKENRKHVYELGKEFNQGLTSEGRNLADINNNGSENIEGTDEQYVAIRNNIEEMLRINQQINTKIHTQNTEIMEQIKKTLDLHNTILKQQNTLQVHQATIAKDIFTTQKTDRELHLKQVAMQNSLVSSLTEVVQQQVTTNELLSDIEKGKMCGNVVIGTVVDTDTIVDTKADTQCKKINVAFGGNKSNLARDATDVNQSNLARDITDDNEVQELGRSYEQQAGRNLNQRNPKQ